MWSIELLSVPIWYWLLGIGILLSTLAASFIHKTAIPILWGGTISVIVLAFSQYLSPAFNGFWIHGYTILGILSLVFLILWLILVFQGCYNSLRYGRVVA